MNIPHPLQITPVSLPLVSGGAYHLPVRERHDPDVVIHLILVARKDVDGDGPFRELDVESLRLFWTDVVDLDVVLEYLVRGVNRHPGLMAKVPDMVVTMVEMVVGVEKDVDMVHNLAHDLVRN